MVPRPTDGASRQGDTAMPKKMRLWRQIAASALMLGLAAGLWLGQDMLLQTVLGAAEPAEKPARRAGRTVLITAAPITTGADDLRFETIGALRAKRAVTLRAGGDGTVASLHMTAGRAYPFGAALMRLDDAEQRLTLSAAEAALGQARRALDRAQQLQGRGASSQASLDDAQTSAELAEIAVARAERDLADRTLRAPFSGVASLPLVEIGDRVEKGDEIGAFDDRRALLIDFDAPERLLRRLSLGQALSAVGAGGAAIPAVISAIDSRIDPATRSARIRARIDDPPAALRPGGSIVVRLDLPGERYPKAPELALQFAEDGLFVWRVAGDTVERVMVQLIRRTPDGVLLNGPLSAGDLVAVEGAQRLARGRKISIVDDPAKPAPPPAPSAGQGS